MLRRRNSINIEEYANKEWTILSRAEYQEIQNLFKRTEQRNGGISFYDLINILKAIGFNIDQNQRDQINQEMSVKEIKIIDSNVVMNQAAALKKKKEEGATGQVAEGSEYLDAFVALGGNVDKTGFVKKTVLIETIEREFELTFDIEMLINGVQGDLLDYSSFCSIFEQDPEKGERLASAASQKSLNSEASIKSLVLDDRDFQKFISQYEGEEASS